MAHRFISITHMLNKLSLLNVLRQSPLSGALAGLRPWVLLGALVLGWGAAVARPLVFGYVVWWAPDVQRAEEGLAHVERLKFMELRLGADGGIADAHGWPEHWQPLRDQAARRGIPVDLAFTLFSDADFNAIFTSPQKVARLRREILAQVGQDGVAGAHLDVEVMTPVQPAAAQAYRRFVAELAADLRAQTPRRLLSVFYFHGAQRQLYDRAALAEADHVIVQGYDAHWLGSELSGPVAPVSGPDVVTWDKMLDEVAQLGVPPQRVLMGFPAFGYEWPTATCQPRVARVGPGQIITFAPVVLPLAPHIRENVAERVQTHGAAHDASVGSSYYMVPQADRSCRVGWFEDWWSLSRKTGWVLDKGVAGLAVFPLGYDGGELVEMAARRFRSPGGKRP